MADCGARNELDENEGRLMSRAGFSSLLPRTGQCPAIGDNPGPLPPGTARRDAIAKGLMTMRRYVPPLMGSRHLGSSAAPPTLISVPDRTQYTKGSLDLDQLDPSDPIKTFTRWFDYARTSGLVTSPEAVTLSTAQLPSGRISSRMVLMKKVDSRGFIIYSNFQTSKKSRDLSTNPRAALNFWWEHLERQVRIEGTTERLTVEESQEYASMRPRDSQMGAWASPQSSVINDRAELDEKLRATHEQFEQTKDIPVPPFWGGLRIVPDSIEFWQGRPNRLHDRYVYEKQQTGDWEIKRLAP